MHVFIPPPNEKIFVILWCGINTCMNNYNNIRDTATADKWLRSNGVQPGQIYIGVAELFQAQKLATLSLRNHGLLMNQEQISTLQNFLKAANSSKRTKITQGQCFQVLNITKKVQRLYSKSTKCR
jgi:hypothetical protein